MKSNLPYAPVHIEQSVNRRVTTLASAVLCVYLTTFIASLAGFGAGFSAGWVYRWFHRADDSPALFWAAQYGGLSALAHAVAGMLGGIFLAVWGRCRWAGSVWFGCYTAVGLGVGILIGMAQTVVPSHYLPEQFWEAPFAASLLGLAASALAARVILRCIRQLGRTGLDAQRRWVYVATSGILLVLLGASSLGSAARGVDFALATVLQFVSFALVLSLGALYVRYRRQTSRLQPDKESDEPGDPPEPPFAHAR